MVITRKQVTTDFYEDKCPYCEKVFQERYENSLKNNMEIHKKTCSKRRIKLNPEVRAK